MLDKTQIKQIISWCGVDFDRSKLRKGGVDFDRSKLRKKDTQEDCWGSKTKGWCRTGDIRVKKPKKTYECWVKSKTTTPPGAQEAMITALQAPNHNFGKDEYVIDMMGQNKRNPTLAICFSTLT